MNDQEIINALIARDERVTRQFFFENCRPLFSSIIRHVFTFNVDYNEFVNEFYLHLMENDARRLKQFQGRSTIYQWLKITAIRYFIAKRDNMIDTTPKEPLTGSVIPEEGIDEEGKTGAQIDIEHLFALMPNKRYVYVIKRLVLQEAEPQTVARELGTNVDNLYNIKKRAIASLTQITLKETEKYEKKAHK